MRAPNMIETILHNKIQLAYIIRADYHAEGVKFFTPDSYSQQLAYMSHKAGHKIDAHVHNQVNRQVEFTQEVLVIRKGRLRVDFYNKNQKYLESRELKAGDIILLASGGHGFQVIEDLEMIEIKQGPYAGNSDKTRFEAIDEKLVKVIKVTQ